MNNHPFSSEKSIFTQESFSDNQFYSPAELLKQSTSTSPFFYSQYAEILSPFSAGFFLKASASSSTTPFMLTNDFRTPLFFGPSLTLVRITTTFYTITPLLPLPIRLFLINLLFTEIFHCSKLILPSLPRRYSSFKPGQVEFY